MRTCGRRLLTRDAAAHCIQIQAAFFRDFDCRANTFASKRWHHNPALLDVQNDCAFRSRIAAGITAALAIAGLGLTGAIGADLVSGVLASAASRLSPSRSGEPSARS